ncbi:MAG: PEGA domain-containing protein, partial [Verrucomicrobiaceae bacterium]
AADYEPRTMGTDKATKNRLPVIECLEHGAQLADIYSLGMVLYEMSTGKDRLQFPELPDDLGEARTRPQWQALNEIILRACSPQPKKRFPGAREMAQALRSAGRRKQAGTGWARRLVNFPLVTAAAAFVILTWRHHGAMPWPPGRFADGQTGIAPPPPLVTGRVSLESDPSGAAIWWHGKQMGFTPFICEVPPGDAEFVLKRDRYMDVTVPVRGVEAGGLKKPGVVKLQFFNPPRPGLDWTNSLDMVFEPRPDGSHISKRAVSEAQFTNVHMAQVSDVHQEDTPEGATIYMIWVPPDEADRFCAQLTERETLLNWLTPDLYYKPVPYRPLKPPPVEKPNYVFFRLAVEKFSKLLITSDPPGAAIYEGDKTEAQGGSPIGRTPWPIPRQVPGDLNFTLTLQGYTDVKITDSVKPGEERTIHREMAKSSMAVFGASWRNSLGQRFMPLNTGRELLFSQWETRVSDYAAFAREKQRRIRGNDMKQTGSHPVVNVTREDARDFCRWLTDREHKSGYLSETMEYRLPSDAEWSAAVNSPNLVVEQATPAQRNMSLSSVYPWAGRYFPPPLVNPLTKTPGVANLGDLTALRAGALGLDAGETKTLEDSKYSDGWTFTAPAGTYGPVPYKFPGSQEAKEKFELCDMSGNVWEFVNDDYGAKEKSDPSDAPDQTKYAVLRGGAWDTSAADFVKLAIHYRRAIPPDKYDSASGFRVVIASVPGEKPEPPVSVTPFPSTFPFPQVVPPLYPLPGSNPPRPVPNPPSSGPGGTNNGGSGTGTGSGHNNNSGSGGGGSQFPAEKPYNTPPMPIPMPVTPGPVPGPVSPPSSPAGSASDGNVNSLPPPASDAGPFQTPPSNSSFSMPATVPVVSDASATNPMPAETGTSRP